MGLVQTKFDHTLKQSDIIIPLTNSSIDESGDQYQNNQPEIQQTLVYGIQSPLIMVNNVVVDFSDVLNFELKGDDVLPSISITIRDRGNLISMIDTPSLDNELRLQILPKFEDKYKKINLTFYITDTYFDNDYITIKGEYKSPAFYSSHIKSFGEINTYKLFSLIATETSLGFATNIEENDFDKRWIYCDNKNYLDLLNMEITRSGYDLQIYDYWVDWWNNIVLIDLYERYNAVDKDEDMKIWISGQNHEVSEGSEITPQEVVASFTNNPAMQTSELYIQNYHISNTPGMQMFFGTDRVYSIYEEQKTDYSDYLIQDGDTKNDIFSKFEYLGETYSDYNYFLSKKKRETFLQKIDTNENIEIILTTPLLGIMRGNRVNLLWYINDSRSENLHKKLQDDQLTNEPQTNIPLNQGNEIEDKSPDGHFILDKSISGQYLVTGCQMNFVDKKWEYKIMLSRPTIDKPKILKENE